jgi:hypothetical protein
MEVARKSPFALFTGLISITPAGFYFLAPI